MSDIMSAPPAPINYTGMQIQPNALGNFMQSANLQANTNLQGAQANQVQQQAALQQQAVQRGQEYQSAYQNFSQNPTPQGAVQLAMSFPELASNVQNAWGQYNEQARQQKLDQISPIVASLQNGRLDIAENLVQQHNDAITNTPGYESDPTMQQDLSSGKNTLSMIQADQQNGTQNALAHGLAVMAAAQGPQDFLTHFGQGQSMPATIATANQAPMQAAANIGLTQSEAQNFQNEVQNRTAQFGLDQNKFLADLQLNLRNLNYQQTAPSMDPATQQQVMKGQMDAVQMGQMADRTGTLLSNVATLGQNGQWGPTGKPGDVQNWWKGFWGNQDNLSALRTEYQAVTQNMNGAAVTGLSPSDKKALGAGVPPPSASDQSVVQFLGALRNSELRQARISDGSSSWAATYGWMGPAKYDANIGGAQIAKGTTFSTYLKNNLAAGSNAPSAYPAPTASPGVQLAPNSQTPSAQQQQAGPLSGPMSRYNQYVTGQ